MSTLDHYAASGETIVFDQAYHNDLVEKLKMLRRNAALQIDTSTGRAVVHPSDGANYPLEPDAVRFNDATGWGLPAEDELRIRWTLVEGPGHLSTTADGSPVSEVTTLPNSAVYWNWAESSTDSYYDNRPLRAWDAVVGGQSLPSAVTVKAEVEALTVETTAPAVDAVADLPSNADEGERRLVRDENAVYEYNSGSWSQATSLSPSDYALVADAQQDIVVSRGYKPGAAPGIVPDIKPQQDVAYLGPDGTVTIPFGEHTTGPVSGTDVSRTVTAEIEHLGSDVTTVNADVSDATTGDKDFEVTASAPGLLLVTAEYDDGTDTESITAGVKVRPSIQLTSGAQHAPTVPPVRVNGGKGQFELKVGHTQPINITRHGPVLDPQAQNWTDAGAQALADRLDAHGASGQNPSLSMLQEAGALLMSALGPMSETTLYEFTVQLQGDNSGAVGQTLLLGTGQDTPSGVLRLTEEISDSPQDPFTEYKAVGTSSDDSLNDAYITGNGSSFPIDIAMAYGDKSNTTFPNDDEVITHTVNARPGLHKTTIPLPRREPQSEYDQWYVRYRPAARWEDGRTVRGDWSSWEEAEYSPQDSATVQFKTDEGLTLEIDGERPVGFMRWEEDPQEQIHALPGSRLSENIPVYPDPSGWQDPTNPPRLRVKFVQTAPAGTAGDIEFNLLELPDTHKNTLPKVTVGGNAIPDSWPVVNGMLVKGDTLNWIGVGNEWVPLGGGEAMLDRIEVFVDDETPGSDAVELNPVEYKTSIAAFSASNVETRLYPSGPVSDITLTSNDHTLLQPASSSLVFVEDGGYYRHRYVIPSDAYGSKDLLQYRVVSGGDQELVSLEVDNTSITDTDDPKVLSATAVPSEQSQEYTVDADRDAVPPRWTLTLDGSSGSWQGSYVTLAASNLGVAEKTSATTSPNGNSIDLSGNRLQTDTDTDPQFVYLNLEDDSFGSEDSVTVTLLLKRSSDSDAPEQTIELKVVNP